MKCHVWSEYGASSENLKESEEVIPKHQEKHSHHRLTYAGTIAFIPHGILK